jgi:ribonuclease Z
MRAAAAGVGAANLTALLLTHLHSDHITDLADVITTRWVTTFAPTPLPIIGPPGTQAVVTAILAALAPDISYRIAHHADITEPPAVKVEEHVEGLVWKAGDVRITVAPTDHRPVEPTIAFRITHDGASVVVAGDSVPCVTLDELADGANMLVHTAIRKDLVEQMPVQRIRDILDYHSSVEQAAATAARAGVDTLVLTHYVPPLVPGQEDQWRALAAGEFSGRVELGEDLLTVSC